MNPAQNTLLIAHRGESYFAPENTLASINLAWQLNADGVEIDVRLSKDNEIVAIHDRSTRRTSGAYRIVKSHHLESLRNLDFGKHKDPKWENEKIPTLGEVLKTVPENKVIFIEIKCGIEIIVPLKKVLENSHLKETQIILISFNLKTISEIKTNFPAYNALWIRRSNTGNLSLNRLTISKIIRIVKQNNLDGINFSMSKKIDEKLVKKIKSENLKVYIWTVNSAQKASDLIYYGVDGIMSDRPSYLREKLKLATEDNQKHLNKL